MLIIALLKEGAIQVEHVQGTWYSLLGKKTHKIPLTLFKGDFLFGTLKKSPLDSVGAFWSNEQTSVLWTSMGVTSEGRIRSYVSYQAVSATKH